MVSQLEARDENSKHNQGYQPSGDFLLSAMLQQQLAHSKAPEIKPGQPGIVIKVSNLF